MADDQPTADDPLVAHYGAGGDVVAAIDAALRAGGHRDARADAPLDPDLLAGADEFHLGGRAAITAMAEHLELHAASRVLDVGRGIGGTARTLARRFGCRVDGVDLTPAFVAVATTLSRRTGLAGSTSFVVGDATALPHRGATFDLVTVVHVGMNLGDKHALAGELARVLVPGGTAVVYDIMQTGPGDLAYPMPWAPTSQHSHLSPPGRYRQPLRAAGLDVVSTTDRSDLVRAALATAAQDPPTVHLGHLMGPGFPQMFANLRDALDRGVVAPVEVRARRPALATGSDA